MTMIGASLLWIGWFGFNAGSNLEANGTAALAFINTFVAPAAAALAWLFVEWGAKGKPSMLGMVSGAVAGLVAVTPAAGFVGPLGAIVLGAVAGVVCFYFVAYARTKIGYDDSLDVFGIHCIGGIIGAIGTGIFVSQSLGGTGLPGLDQCLGIGPGIGHGDFDLDMLTGLEAGDGLFGMDLSRRAQDHRIDFGQGQ